MHDTRATHDTHPQLLRPARMGTWEFNLATGRVVWSSSLEELHGIPVGSFDGTFEAYQSDIHPDDRARVLATTERNIAAKQGHALFYRIVRPDGAVRWLDARGEFMRDAKTQEWRLVGVCADVTDVLLENARRAFLAEATSALATSLDHDGTLQTVARLAVPRLADWCAVDVFKDPQERSLGIERIAMAHVDPAKVELGHEILRRFPPDLVTPGYAELFARREPMLVPAVTDAMLVASARGPEHLELVRKVGLCSLIVAPIEMRGVIIGLVTVATAESKRTMTADDVACVRELCATTAVALENARLYREAKQEARTREDVVAIVSHDLRTPLTAILLGASSLLRREDVDDKTTATARRMLASAERASRMTRDLLDFTQARLAGIPVEPRLVDLDEIVRAVVEEMRAVHPDRVIDLHAERTQGRWDRDRLMQVLSNLLGNALEHSPPQARVRVAATTEGKEALVTVHNEGPPIPADQQAMIFEPFSRGRGPNKTTQGLGLGLYIAAQIVRAHHGRIELVSAAPEGTSFIVRLPR